ncbi:MAG: hypothetical protein FJ257_12165 [Phycisphaerae bacterium]|nr:hypothetical protein [Phycisphaerae bacterium]
MNGSGNQRGNATPDGSAGEPSGWHFFRKQSSEAEKNSTTGQHFRGKDRSPAAMLVREGFQNSLDARASCHESVRIRIYTSLAEGALHPAAISSFIAPELVEHLQSPGSGVDASQPDCRSGPCPFLVFEDFGTNGLTGSVEADSSSSIWGERNSFYYFMRAEGINDKSGGNLGSWGVGKTVFPSSSRIRTILVASNRRGDPDRPSVVMGRCVLNYHTTSTTPGVTWRPDAWFGIKDHREGGFVLPTTRGAEHALLDRFRVSRGLEPGLSVVVPFVDPEDFSVQDLLAATLQECCFAIARGILVVTLESPEGRIEIDLATMRDAVGQVADPDARRRLAEMVELAHEHAREVPHARQIELIDHKYPHSIKWDDENWIDDGRLSALRSAWSSDGQAWIRVPIRVRRKHAALHDADSLGEIRVLLRRDDDAGTSTPILVRDGLLIPGQAKSDRPMAVHGARAVIQIGDDAVGRLVRDAEDPSHIKLDPRAEKVKSSYLYGPSYIAFIRQSASELLRLIRGDEEEDRDLLSDLIGLISEESKPRRRPTQPEPPVVPPIDSRPLLLLSRLDAEQGFAYRHDPNGDRNVKSFRVRFAYDCDERDPFLQYEPFDFEVGKTIDIQATGARWAKTAENAIEVEVDDPDFEVRAVGFDGRDIAIRLSKIVREGDGACRD